MELEIKGLADGLDTFKKEAKAAIETAELEAKTAKEVSVKLGEDLTEVKSRLDAHEMNAKVAREKAAKPSFGEAFAKSVEENFEAISKVKKGQPFKMELKTVGNMLLSSNLTGDSVASYSTRQAILPSQKINFRDLIPTAQSATGLYVQYKETVGEGAIAAQTEGSSKGQIDFDFAEVKIVNDYVAGFATYSKQMMKSLPWIQGTLPRLLMRSFYEAENSIFFTAVSGAATGSTTTAETDDVKQLIDYIANQRTAKFAASFGLISHKQLARLNKLTYVNGYYSGSGGVVTAPDGTMTISGMPVIPVDWVTDDKVLIIDRDYLERVEVESLNITFSEEEGNNFTKNLITARIECYEDINLMLPTSSIYADLGNLT